MELWGMDVMIQLLSSEEYKRMIELDMLLIPYKYYDFEKEEWMLPEELPAEIEPLRQELKKLEEKEKRIKDRLEKEGPFVRHKVRGPGRYKNKL